MFSAKALTVEASLTPYTDIWLKNVNSRGGSVSANTLAAVKELEKDLRIASLIPKLIYFNPRCGSDIIAARSALIYTNGTGFDTLTGTFSSWSEVNGLAGTTGVADLGVVPSAAGISLNAVSAGIYNLTNKTSNSHVIRLGNTLSGLYLALFGDYLIFDKFNGGTGRTQTSESNRTTETRGLMCGSQYSSTVSAVFRNGEIRGSGGAASGTVPSTAATLISAAGTSGGDFIGLALTPDDVSNLTWIMHTFNVALGRGVTAAEGLF